jgi:hypothetical protein
VDLTGIGEAATAAQKIIGMFFPDKTAEDQAKLASSLALLNAQTDIDKAEAAQPGMHFRDGAGWVCVFAFGLMALKAPIEWGAALAGHPITLPPVDTSVTNDMLFGLLGLGGMHVYQQTAGKSS